MAKYTVQKPINFGSGYVKDGSGKMVAVQSFAPKVGDVIELGEPVTLYTNQPQKGYTYFITKNGITRDNKMFIPQDAVELILGEKNETTQKSTDNPSPDKFKLTDYLQLALILGLLSLSIYGLNKALKEK